MMNSIYRELWIESLQEIEEQIEEVKGFLNKENLTHVDSVELECELINMAGTSRFLLAQVQKITDTMDYDEIVKILRD